MRDASDVRRVAAIGGVTAAAVVMLLLGKPVLFATTAPKVAVAQATEPRRAETETVTFVTSPSLIPILNFSSALVIIATAITARESPRWCATRGCHSSHVVPPTSR